MDSNKKEMTYTDEELTEFAYIMGLIECLKEDDYEGAKEVLIKEKEKIEE